MPDYSKSLIYSISAEGIDGVYIGATTLSLAQRMATHRHPSSRCCSKPLIDTGKAVIELVENYPCNSKEELDVRERYWIENIRIALNKKIPGRTAAEYDREYNAAHREQINAHQREYDAAHREQKKAYQREYNAAHREQRNAYNHEYQAAHREQINAYKRELYAKNKAGTTVDGPAPAAPEADSNQCGADGLYSPAGAEGHENPL